MMSKNSTQSTFHSWPNTDHHHWAIAPKKKCYKCSILLWRHMNRPFTILKHSRQVNFTIWYVNALWRSCHKTSLRLEQTRFGGHHNLTSYWTYNLWEKNIHLTILTHLNWMILGYTMCPDLQIPYVWPINTTNTTSRLLQCNMYIHAYPTLEYILN